MLRRILRFRRRAIPMFSGPHPRRNEIRPNDSFVASFPRSGNTWLRLLLADAFLQRQGLATNTRLPVHQDQVIPDLDTRESIQVDPQIELSFRLLKTHWHHQPFMKRTLLLFRRPTSSLSSYYHFQRRYPQQYRRANRGIDAFCEESLPDWLAHANSFLAIQNKQDYLIKVVWYQQLWTEPAATLQQCLQWLDLDAPLDICTRAVENHTFKKQRARETQPRFGQYFFRRGELDSGRSELGSRVYERIVREAEPTFQALCRASSTPSGSSVSLPISA